MQRNRFYNWIVSEIKLFDNSNCFIFQGVIICWRSWCIPQKKEQSKINIMTNFLVYVAFQMNSGHKKSFSFIRVAAFENLIMIECLLWTYIANNNIINMLWF